MLKVGGLVGLTTKIMETTKTFSIIIPVYNVSKYLVDCLDSVLCQEVSPECYEIIVIDDCSPDAEKAIVEDYMLKYDNIRYIRHETNKRQGGARNTGMVAACGEYVMFLDGDDCLVYRNTLSVLLELIREYRPVVLRSETYLSIPSEVGFSQLGVELGIDESYNSGGMKPVSCDFIEWRSGRIKSVAVWGTLYKRGFLVENKLFFRENVLFEDTDWTQKTLFGVGAIDFVDFPFYGYRQSPASVTRGCSVAAFDGAVKGVVESYEFYRRVIKPNDLFWNVLCDVFVKDVVDLLRISRNYPIKDSLGILEILNDRGMTSLRCKDGKKNAVLFIMSFLPILPIAVVRALVKVKRMYARWLAFVTCIKNEI